MLYPLYEFYSQSPMDLYQVRNHFLEHFYYMEHSRNKATDVLKSIVSSSKVGRLLKESIAKNTVPNCEDFLSVINSMWKFMFKSNDTQALATIDAALRWDIEINQKLYMVYSEDLKQSVIKVFDKLQVYKEMTKEEFFSVIGQEPTDTSDDKKLPKLKTWELSAFSDKFGNIKVEEYTNSNTGEIFHSCVCQKGTTKTFISFSSKLGELTEEEISSREKELVVVQLPSGKYKLAKKGR